jgi:hypothetical protein
MVRFRNGALLDGLIRKNSNESRVPVGPNGCHKGAESPATAPSERPRPQGIRVPGAAREILAPFAARGPECRAASRRRRRRQSWDGLDGPR